MVFGQIVYQGNNELKAACTILCLEQCSLGHQHICQISAIHVKFLLHWKSVERNIIHIVPQRQVTRAVSSMYALHLQVLPCLLVTMLSYCDVPVLVNTLPFLRRLLTLGAEDREGSKYSLPGQIRPVIPSWNNYRRGKRCARATSTSTSMFASPAGIAAT